MTSPDRHRAGRLDVQRARRDREKIVRLWPPTEQVFRQRVALWGNVPLHNVTNGR